MSKKTWKPHIDTLRADPGDARALDALESYLEAQSARSTKKTVGVLGTSSRFAFKMFLGKLLYNAVQDAWDAWSLYLQGDYVAKTQVAWPELETRDVSAALAARFLRIGMFGIFIGFIPAILLGFQTTLMIVQVWQVNTQNEIIREQNGLTREQFGVGYRAQLIEKLYQYEPRTITVGESSYKVCEAATLPHVRAEAVASLIKLERVLAAGAPRKEDPPSERAPVTASLEGACLAGVGFASRDLSGGSFDAASFYDASLKDVTLVGASLREAGLQKTKFQHVNLDGADLSGAIFAGARLEGVSFKGATLLDLTVHDTILSGVDFSSATFYPGEKPVLRERQKIDFSRSNVLKKIDFSQANLIRARFNDSTLLDVTFAGARLIESNFEAAQLTKVSFKGAQLARAKFARARLTDVDLSETTLSAEQLGAIASFKNVTCPNGKNSDKQNRTCKP